MREVELFLADKHAAPCRILPIASKRTLPRASTASILFHGAIKRVRNVLLVFAEDLVSAIEPV